ncbi:hypothetical protein WIS52_16350 [Pseudonocardia nematodicida]|uniref:Uncharacterized protein n=1 Tax=Pseudonocardia nematodicida TaxID=1206997 RepID=A0ABV1KC42_9PSEU
MTGVSRGIHHSSSTVREEATMNSTDTATAEPVETGYDEDEANIVRGLD